MASLQQGLQLRQQQRLVMTPLMQQAIKLLQLSRLELVEKLQQELTQNPVLEEADEIDQEEEEEEATASEQDENEAQAPPSDDGKPQEVALEQAERANPEEPEFDWDAYLGSLSENDVQEERLPTDSAVRDLAEVPITRSESLHDHLRWQLRLSSRDDEEYKIGEVLIGNIDDHGYLTATLEEVAPAVPADVASVEKALLLIQTFDPPGVGARTVPECLLIQLRTLGQLTPELETLITRHFEDVENKRTLQIAKSMGIPPERVQTLMDEVAKLDPKPGRSYSSDEPIYIIPDVVVAKVDSQYVVLVNDDGMPRLRVSPYYRRMLASQDGAADAKQFVQEKLQSALWLIKSLEQRKKTLYRVTEAIVKLQRDFFDRGVAGLHPLTLRQIADEIGMHESTVSRVTSNKYVQTPRGVFPLKFFFSSGLSTAEGDRASSTAVKDQIRDLIATEDTQHPFSDDQVARMLSRQGLQIARRTVAKYREQLLILPANKRRQYRPPSATRPEVVEA